MRDNAVVFHLPADLTITPLCTAKSKNAQEISDSPATGGDVRLLAITFAGLVLVQSGAVSGTWTAVYGDTTYIRRRVRVRPVSAMSIGHSIRIYEEGNVDSATPAPEVLTRMLDAHWIGEVLSLQSMVATKSRGLSFD